MLKIQIININRSKFANFEARFESTTQVRKGNQNFENAQQAIRKIKKNCSETNDRKPHLTIPSGEKSIFKLTKKILLCALRNWNQPIEDECPRNT